MEKGFMFSWVQSQPRWLLFSEVAVFLGAIGFIDVVSGRNVSLFPFYGLAVATAAWFCGERFGYAAALLAGCVWLRADFATGHVYETYQLQAWETSLRFVFYVLVAFAVATARKESDAARAKIALLEHNQTLEQQVIEISEYEQRRIGQDLHDGLCQYLAALSCAAVSLKTELESRGANDLATRADELADLLQGGMHQARDLARGLVPAGMEEGLATAMQRLAASTKRLQGVECHFDGAGGSALDDAAAAHLFRIAQEAINNAIKHGKARSVEIRLSSSPDACSLSIADYGTGIPAANKHQDGLGLSIMRYRAKLLGAQLLVENASHGGTVVSCSFATAGAA